MKVSTLFPLRFDQEFPDDSARSDASLRVKEEREAEAAPPASDEKDEESGEERVISASYPASPSFPFSPSIPSLLLLLSSVCIAVVFLAVVSKKSKR